MNTETLARALGWFSIGLGLTEAVAGKPLSDALGIRHANLTRAYGLREIGVGVGILASPSPPPPGWLWARFAGDLVDIATLLSQWQNNPKQQNLAVALAAVGGVTVLDYVCAQQLDDKA